MGVPDIFCGKNIPFWNRPLLFALPLLFLFPTFLLGDSEGERIIKEVIHQPLPKTSRAKVLVILEPTSQGKGVRQEREMEVFVRNQKGSSGSLIRFLAPPDVKGVSLLVVEKEGKREQWLYLPALKQDPRRVGGAQKNQSFLGTDFSFADLEGTDLESWDHTYMGKVTEEGIPSFKIRSTPKDPGSTPYTFLIQWIHEKENFPWKVEFYDEKGKWKELRVLKWERMNSYLLTTETTMTDLRNDHRTVLRVTERELDIPLPPQFFTPREMKR